MKKYEVNGSIKTFIVFIVLYEAALCTNILLATLMAPIMFFMHSDANPTGPVGALRMIVGYAVILLGVFSPISFLLNVYMIFSKKSEHPKWFLWILPAPFLLLLLLALNGLGLKPFIPFSFN